MLVRRPASYGSIVDGIVGIFSRTLIPVFVKNGQKFDFFGIFSRSTPKFRKISFGKAFVKAKKDYAPQARFFRVFLNVHPISVFEPKKI